MLKRVARRSLRYLALFALASGYALLFLWSWGAWWSPEPPPPQPRSTEPLEAEIIKGLEYDCVRVFRGQKELYTGCWP